jgi:hypothetical protein
VRIPRSAARALAAALTGAAVSCGAAACGSTGTNGVATKSTGSIVKSAEDAIVGAASFRVQGDIGSGAQAIKLDMRLVRGQGASGTVQINGSTIELLRVGQEVYVKGDAAFYHWVVANVGGGTPAPTPSAPATSGATPAHKPTTAKGTPTKSPTKGKATPAPTTRSTPGDITLNAMKDNYLHIAPSDPSYHYFASLTDARQLTDQVLAGVSGLSKDGQESIRGSRAIILSGAHDAKVFVGIDGPAYLLRVLPDGGGTIDFLDFGAAVNIVAPAPDHVVDISKIAK